MIRDLITQHISNLKKIFFINRLKSNSEVLNNSYDEDFIANCLEEGKAYAQSGEYQSAREKLQLVIKSRPEHFQARYLLAISERLSGRYADSISLLRDIFELDQDNPQVGLTLCLLYQDQRQYSKAVDCFEQLITHDPGNHLIKWNYRQLLLLLRDYEKGWEYYSDSRDKAGIIPYQPIHRVWSGEDVAGKTILLRGEQGVGDELMFASCITELTRDASKIYMMCLPKLVVLFRRSFPEIAVFPNTYQKNLDVPVWEDQSIDYELPLTSLGVLYRRSVSQFPQSEGYLKVDANKANRWMHWLSTIGEGLKIGISWKGGVPDTRRYIRSIPLEQWKGILGTKNCTFVNLQYADFVDDINMIEDETGLRIWNHQDAIDDYDETAALVSSLDLVISVCTSVVSLASALNKEAWVLVPSSPGWVFGTSDVNTEWLPSARLYRQETPGDWLEAIDRVSEDLKNRASKVIAG